MHTTTTNPVKQVEEMKNESTGTTFFVIGETSQLKVALRVWQDTWMSLPFGQAAIIFRVRVEAKEPSHIDLKTLADFEVGQTDWSGSGSKHLSKAGYMKLAFPLGYGVEHYFKFIKDIGALESLYTELVKQYSTVEWKLNTEEFVNLFYAELYKTKPSIPAGLEMPPFVLEWSNSKPPSMTQSGPAH